MKADRELAVLQDDVNLDTWGKLLIVFWQKVKGKFMTGMVHTLRDGTKYRV